MELRKQTNVHAASPGTKTFNSTLKALPNLSPTASSRFLDLPSSLAISRFFWHLHYRARHMWLQITEVGSPQHDPVQCHFSVHKLLASWLKMRFKRSGDLWVERRILCWERQLGLLGYWRLRVGLVRSGLTLLQGVCGGRIWFWRLGPCNLCWWGLNSGD